MCSAWVTSLVLALVTLTGPWSAAAATFNKVGVGACRTSSGAQGDFIRLSAFRDECEDICDDDATCVAFEVRPPGLGGECEIHRAQITRTSGTPVADCFVRQTEDNRRNVIALNASRICREEISNLAAEFARATGGPIPRESLKDALAAPTIEISADGLSITTDTGVEMAVLRINASGRPGSGKHFDQSIMRLAVTNGLNVLLKDVLAERQRIFLGNIKDDGEVVKIDAYIVEVTDDAIQNATDTQMKIENVADLDAAVATILEDVLAGCIGDDTVLFNVQTNVDVVNVDRSVFKFVLVGVMMVSTFLICLTYCVGSCIEFHTKSLKNKEFRTLRKAADNPRILFNNGNGKVCVESVRVDIKTKQFDNILERLSSLTEKHRFGSKILFEYNKALRGAKQIADICAPTVRMYFLQEDGAQNLTLTFDKMDKLLTELDSRQRPSGTKDEINNNINQFKEELLVLHAVFGPGMNAIIDVFRNSKSPLYDKLKLLTKRATQVKQSIVETTPTVQKLEPLEPREVVEGLYVRDKHRNPLALLLSLNSRLKDKFGISTHRLFLGTLGIFLAFGPFRFLGLGGKILVGSVVALAILLELAHGSEDFYLFGVCTSLKRNIFRIVVLLVLVILFAEFITFSTDPNYKPASLLPETNFDLRDYGNANYSRFGPIELPPDHNNLPRDPIDTRRTFLGVPPQYKLEEVLHQKYYVSVIFGIMHGNLLVLCLLPLPICYAFQTLLVRISPLMRHVLPMNPVWLHRTLGHVLLFGLSFTGFLWFVFQGHSCFSQEVSIVEVEGRHMPRACLAFDPGAQAGKEVYMLRFEIVWPLAFFFIPLMIFYEYPRTTNRNMALNSTAAFGYNRLLEILAVAVVFAGCLISLEPGFGYIPFWFIIAGFMALHFTAVVGCCVRHLVSSSGCNSQRPDNWTSSIQKSWWEIAYWCHAFAFSISIAAALYLRFQVFYGALVPWTIYILDRLYGVYCSCAYNAQIVVEGEKASYTVVGDDGVPSYVRLVLRKPRCFKYNAGQWCHLGFENAGKYCGVPGNFLPFLEWHAFSIASCNQSDNEFLEFHIGVHGGGRAAIDNLSNVWVTKPFFGNDLMLISSYAEWWCPHRVAVQNSKAAPLEILDKKCQAEEEGIYLVLKPQDGVNKLKLLKPQAQWTGKLWNTVEMLLHQNGCQNKHIRIMGPYGTLPATAFAHPALMLISAGVGFPSSVSLLRKCLEDNLEKEQDNQQAVCFMWGASKFDQLLLCFPTLLVDLTWYVHRKSKLMQGSTRQALEDLKSWLSIKIFIGKVETGDFLVVNPDRKLFPNAEDMTSALQEVRSWLLNANVKRNGSGNFADEHGHGTYIAQGSIGGSFGDVLRCSTFTREKVMKRPNSLGVCFCGPLDLSRWIQFEVENTVFPKTVEFASEATA